MSRTCPLSRVFAHSASLGCTALLEKFATSKATRARQRQSPTKAKCCPICSINLTGLQSAENSSPCSRSRSIKSNGSGVVSASPVRPDHPDRHSRFPSNHGSLFRVAPFPMRSGGLIDRHINQIFPGKTSIATTW